MLSFGYIIPSDCHFSFRLVNFHLDSLSNIHTAEIYGIRLLPISLQSSISFSLLFTPHQPNWPIGYPLVYEHGIILYMTTTHPILKIHPIYSLLYQTNSSQRNAFNRCGFPLARCFSFSNYSGFTNVPVCIIQFLNTAFFRL